MANNNKVSLSTCHLKAEDITETKQHKSFLCQAFIKLKIIMLMYD